MKRTETQSYRLTEESKKALGEIAEKLKIPPGLIVATLVEQYIDARKEHGDRLIWPPRFTYYEPEAKTSQQRTNLENASSVEKAG